MYLHECFGEIFWGTIYVVINGPGGPFVLVINGPGGPFVLVINGPHG